MEDTASAFDGASGKSKDIKLSKGKRKMSGNGHMIMSPGIAAPFTESSVLENLWN